MKKGILLLQVFLGAVFCQGLCLFPATAQEDLYEALQRVVSQVSPEAVKNLKDLPLEQRVPAVMRLYETLPPASPLREALLDFLVLQADVRALPLFERLLATEWQDQIVEALGRMRSPQATPLLLKALKDHSFPIGVLAALAENGDPSALPAIKAITTDPEDLIAKTAASAAIRLGEREDMKILLLAASDLIASDTQALALRHLSQLAQQATDRAAIVNALSAHNRAEIQTGAVHALVNMGHQVAIPAILKALPNLSGISVAPVLWAFDKEHPDAVLPMFIKVIQDDSITFEPAYTQNLQAPEPAFDALTSIFNDASANVQVRIAQSLAHLNSSRVVDFVSQHYATQYEPVQIALIDALHNHPRSADFLLSLLQSDASDGVKASAARILGHLGEPRAIALLLQALTKGGEDYRWAAVGALGDLRTHAALEPLLTDLRQVIAGTYPYHSQLIEALGKIGDSRATPLILEYYETVHDRPVEGIIIRTLGQLGDSQAVPELLQRLAALNRSDHAEYFSQLADVLGELNDPRAVPGLLDALSQAQNPSVRDSLLEALGKIGGPQALAALHEDLQQNATPAAAIGLYRQGQVSNAADLALVAHHGEKDIAATALVKLRAQASQAGPALLKHPQVTVRQAIAALWPQLNVDPQPLAEAFARDGTISASAAPSLVKLDQATPAAQIVTAAQTGALARETETLLRSQPVTAIRKWLTDSRLPVQEAAATLLSRWGEIAAEAEILKANASVSQSSLALAEALVRLGYLENLEVLLTALDSRDWKIINTAQAALKHWPQKELRQALQDPRVDIRSGIIKVLPHRDALDTVALEQALVDPEPAIRLQIIKQYYNVNEISYHGTAAHLHHLSQALADPNPKLRSQVLSFLGYILKPEHATEWTPRLIPYAQDADAEVRAAAMWSLTPLKDPVALDTFTKALKDEHMPVRLYALYALGKLPAEYSAPALLPLLWAQAPNLREGAAYALGDFASESAVSPLISRLNDPERRVRTAALWSLGQIESPQVLPVLLQQLPHIQGNALQNVARALAQRSGDDITAALKQALLRSEALDSMVLLEVLLERGTQLTPAETQQLLNRQRLPVFRSKLKELLVLS